MLEVTASDRRWAMLAVVFRALAYAAVGILLLWTGISALDEPDATKRAVCAYIALPFLAVATGYTCVLLFLPRTRRLPKVAGIPVRAGDGVHRARFGAGFAFGLAYASFAGLSLLAGVVGSMTILTGTQSPGFLSLANVYAVPLVFGPIVFVIAWVRRGPAFRELRVDTGASRLFLVDADRKPCRIDFASVIAINHGLAKDETLSTEQTVWIDTVQPPRRYRVGSWPEPPPAQEFAAWLRALVDTSPANSAGAAAP